MNELVLIVLAVFAFLFVSAKVTLLRLFCGVTYRPAGGDLVDRSTLPSGLLTQFDIAARKLYQLGFELSHYEKREDASPELTAVHWVMVLRHQTEYSFAELSVPSNPDVDNRVNFTYLTYFDSVDLVSRHLSLSVINDHNDSVLFNDFTSADPVEQWVSHLDFVTDGREAEVISGEAQYPDPANYLIRRKGSFWRYLAAMESQGTIDREGLDYRIRFSTGISSLLTWNKRQRIALKALGPDSQSTDDQWKDEPLDGFSTVQATAYKRNSQLQETGRFDFRTKAVLSLLSFIAFALLFGLLFSWDYVLALVPVLLFHELGHLAAMRLFGYRDLLLLFIPLGAVAIGQESEQHKPWQEAVVLLAGPVPGILLAFAALLFWPDHPHWVEVLIYVSLLLNYFNLLPVMPLDGGQLMQLALFKRRPFARLIFKVISAIVFALSAMFGSEPVLLILSAFLALSCLIEIRDWWVVRKCGESFRTLDEIEDNVERAFAALNDRKELFVKKCEWVGQMISPATTNAPRFSTSVSIVLVYVVIMTGPLIGAAGYLLTADAFEYDEAMSEAQYWDEQLAVETDPDVRFSLMMEASDWVYEEDSQSRTRYLDAAAELALAQNNEQQYSEAMLGLTSHEYYNEDSTAAIDTYWTWSEKSSLIDENVFEATRMLSGFESTELAYPFAARRLSLAVRQADYFEEFDAYVELAYRHIEKNQPHYTNYFVDQAQNVVLKDQDLDHYKQTTLAELYLAIGQPEKAIHNLKVIYQQEQQNESWLDSTSVAADLGWLELEQGNLKKAAIYFSDADRYMEKFQAAMGESVGLVGRMMLGSEGLDYLQEDGFWQWEYRLVIASQLKDEQGYEHALSVILENFDDLASAIDSYTSESSVNPRFSSEAIKHRLIVKALKSS